MTHVFFQKLSLRFPQLKLKLAQAEIDKEPAEFTKQTFMSSIYLTIAVYWVVVMLVLNFDKSPVVIILTSPLFFALAFFYFMKLPDAYMIRKSKEIDREIIFAGKFMIVELKSGVSLYQALKNVAENYGGIGRYFERIIQDIDLGTETQEAINKAILINPSINFQKIMWQISNAMQTGADLASALDSVLEQISREQLIEVEKYGKKLNPIAMFYLMMAVIFPSLGMVMGVVFASFVNIRLSLPALLFISFLLTCMQFMFYATIKSMRPAVDM